MRRFILSMLFILPVISFAGISGDFTIGSGGDYPTFTAAIADLELPAGISGPVVFKLLDPTYNEQIVFNKTIIGASTTNTITFDSHAEISYAGTSTANYIVKIKNAEHIIFRNITFTTLGTTYSRIVESNDPKGNITFINNVFNGKTNPNNADLNQALIYCNADVSTENLNNFNFSGNVFNNGSYGLYLKSHNSTKSNNLEIVGNTFNTFNSGIRLEYFNAPSITSNISTNSGDDYAFYLSKCDNSFDISNNKISSLTNAGKGIYLVSCNTLTNTYGNLINNFIQTSDEGIYLANSNYIQVYFNSINVAHPTLLSDNSTTSIEVNSVCTNIFVYNNILSNKREGFTYIGHTEATNFCDNNNLYTNGSNIAKWNNINITTFSAFKAASSSNVSSFNEEITFTSISDLHIQSSPIALNGTTIATVTADIDGDTRNSPPFIGADEFLLPLSGSYAIGPTGFYTTITEAVNGLYQRGISGLVTFNIQNGSYPEQLSLPSPITGASATNTVTFQSQSGDPENVNINFQATSALDNFVIEIGEAEHLIFNKLKFTANGTDFARVLVFANSTGNNKFTSNIFNGYLVPLYNSSDDQTLIICDNSGSLNNYIFENNTLNNGHRGFYLYASLPTSYLQIKGNTIISKFTGMHLQNCDNTLISSNSIELLDGTGVTLTSCDGFAIEKNTILETSGYYIQSCDGSASEPCLFTNNFISSRSGGATFRNCKFVDILYNTINLESSGSGSTTSSAFQTQAICSDLNVLNNILYNQRDGYALKTESGHLNSSNYNNLFSSGTNITKLDANEYATLSAFQTASSMDANSYSAEVEFTSISDLHIESSAAPLYGTPIASLTDDIDGDTRNNPPFIGADEPPLAEISVTILLEGPYNGSNMNTALNGSLPEQQPFSAPVHLGSESVADGFFSAHTNIVDWVVVELRSELNTKGETRAGFLLNSGVIVDLDGSSPLTFIVEPGNYQVVVHHRNHLPVMSSSFVSAD